MGTTASLSFGCRTICSVTRNCFDLAVSGDGGWNRRPNSRPAEIGCRPSAVLNQKRVIATMPFEALMPDPTSETIGGGNLRIVDDSIMPRITTCNTMAPIIIGEQPPAT